MQELDMLVIRKIGDSGVGKLGGLSLRVEVGKVGVGVEGAGVDDSTIGNGIKGMQIDSSIGDSFHDFPCLDVHRPIVSSFQSSMAVIAGRS